MSFIEEAVEELETFEQILVEEKGYVAETYGKWHVPASLYYSRPSAETKRRIIDANDYVFATRTPQFEPVQSFKTPYQREVRYLATEQDGVNPNKYQSGQQKNYFSKYPYSPIRLDARYGYPTNTELKEEQGFEKWQMGNSNVAGRDSLGVNHTSTAVLGKMALASLDRLIANVENKPFSLSVHINAPHPPMVATGYYLDKYWNQRSQLFSPPSMNDSMRDSAYRNENGRNRIDDSAYAYNNPGKMSELTAVYYGMIEELDFWVGELVKRIERAGLSERTLIVFTADHGDMLGAHGMVGKGILLEEAVRVPLVMRYDGKISAGQHIKVPVSHMDLFGTILEYMGASDLDRSDGSSLCRYIDRTYFNQVYDERVVVSEMDRRVPLSNRQFTRGLGDEPNLMIRKGDFTLILPKKAGSSVLDMVSKEDIS